MPSPAHADVRMEPLEHQPAHRVVADALRGRLARGDLRPGDRLPPERLLAEQLGVGRMTVRQALRELAADGLLVTRRGRHGGTVVADEPRPSAGGVPEAARHAEELRENYEFRLALEPAIARLAAERATAEQAAELMALAAESVNSAPVYRAIDSRFHIALARASGNRLAVDAVRGARETLFAWADALWGAEDWDRHAETISRALLDHAVIARAVEAGDGALAEERMRHHLTTSVAAFTRIIDDMGAAGRLRSGEG